MRSLTSVGPVPSQKRSGERASSLILAHGKARTTEQAGCTPLGRHDVCLAPLEDSHVCPDWSEQGMQRRVCLSAYLLRGRRSRQQCRGLVGDVGQYKQLVARVILIAPPDVQAPMITTFLPIWSLAEWCSVECNVCPRNCSYNQPVSVLNNTTLTEQLTAPGIVGTLGTPPPRPRAMITWSTWKTRSVPFGFFTSTSYLPSSCSVTYSTDELVQTFNSNASA